MAATHSPCAPRPAQRGLPRDLIPPGQAADLIGCSAQHVRNLAQRGELSVWRLPGSGHRRVSRAEVLKWAGLSEPSESEGVSVSPGGVRLAVYARISSRGTTKKVQNADGESEVGQLQRQIDDCVAHSREVYGVEQPTIFKEIQSGLNLSRPKFLKVIELMTTGKLDVLLVTFRDRFTRYGYELIAHLARIHNVKIVEVRKQEEVDESETELDVSFLMDFLHCYIIRGYARRAGERRRIKLPAEAIQRIRQLETTHSITQIQRVLKQEGFTCEKGREIKYAVVKRVVRQQYLIQKAKDKDNHLRVYADRYLEKTDEPVKTKSADVYRHYYQFCQSKNLIAASRARFSAFLTELGFPTTNYNERGKICRAFAGLKVVGENLHHTVRAWGKNRTHSP